MQQKHVNSVNVLKTRLVAQELNKYFINMPNNKDLIY